MTTTDGRKVRGARSRAAIMRRAVDVASVGGLDALSIGGLASEVSVSKSGVVALFGSKEQLELATIETARQIFIETVIHPALAVPGGIERVRALLDGWLNYSETRVFAGGCFFASAMVEFGAKTGPVRDAVAASLEEWHEFVRRTLAKAIERGELAADASADQLTFEVTAILDGANAASLLLDSAEPYARARIALKRIVG